MPKELPFSAVFLYEPNYVYPSATTRSMFFRWRMALRSRCTLVRLLMHLHVLLLLRVFLLELLSLLSVALFHLLFLRFAGIFLGRLLVLFFLLLLQLLVFLILLSGELVLLLLIFLVSFSVAGAWRRVLVGLNFAGMCVCWMSLICSRCVFGRFVRSAGFLGRYCAALKISGLGRSCYRRLALIRGGAQLRVGTSLLHMLVLCRNRSDMALLVVCFLLRRRPLVDTAITAIVADAVSRVVFNPSVIGVVDVLVVYAIYRGVVIKMIVFPPTAFVAVTTVAEPVIDAAIISNVRAPITFMEEECIAAPSPVSGGPKEADFGSFDPSAGHPVVVVTVPSPITGRPDVAVPGTDGLLIDGERGRAKSYRNADLSK